METYNSEDKTIKKYKDSYQRSFFPRSLVNDWVPTWEKIVFFLLGFIGIDIISTAVGMVLVLFYGNSNNVNYGVYLFLTYLVLAICFMLFLFLDGRKTYQKVFIGFADKKTYIYGAIGFVGILAINFIFNIIYSNIDFYTQNANQTGIESYTKAAPILMCIAVVILAPFCEELTYRVGLCDSIGHKNRVLGIIFSAIIFGLIHFDFSSILELFEATYFKDLYNSGNLAEATEETLKFISDENIAALQTNLYIELLNLPEYISAGLLLGFIYTKSGNISSSMFVHLLNNTLSMIGIFLLVNPQNTFIHLL